MTMEETRLPASVLTLPRPKLKIRLDLKNTVTKTEEITNCTNGLLERSNIASHTFEEHVILRLPHDIVEKLSKNTSMGVFKGMNSDEKIISESAGNVPLSTSQFKDSPGEESSHDNAEELDVSRITIDFGNQRVARVLVDQNIVLVGLLLDLPTLVESMRGVERAIYCKIADISQMLVCFHLEDLSSAHESARDVSMLSKSSIDSHLHINIDGRKSYGAVLRGDDVEMSQFLQLGPVKDLVSRYESQGWMLHDGLTPPMKGAIALQSHNLSSQEQAISSLSNQGGGGVDLAHRMLVDDIERQVQALIDRDTAADSSSFSIIDTVTKRLLISGGGVDGKIVKHTTTEEGSIFGAASVIGDDMSQTTTAVDNEIEGESVSYRTVEDDQDDEDFAAELEGEIMMADTSSQRDSSAPSQSPSLPSQKMSAIPFESGNSVVSQPNILSSQQGVEAISNSEMTMSPADRELQQKINERKSQLTSLTNPLIRARLEEVIRDLENNLAQRRGL